MSEQKQVSGVHGVRLLSTSPGRKLMTGSNSEVTTQLPESSVPSPQPSAKACHSKDSRNAQMLSLGALNQ